MDAWSSWMRRAVPICFVPAEVETARELR